TPEQYVELILKNNSKTHEDVISFIPCKASNNDTISHDNKTTIAKQMAGQENNNKCLLLLAIEIIRKKLERLLLTKPAIRPFALMALDARSSSHIESATRLLPNASEKLGQNYNITIIKSTNTDLLLLATSAMNTSNPTWVDVSPGNSKNEVKTLDVAERYREFFIRYMVPNEILLTLHALSGTKLTSHIRGISKKTIFEAFLNNTEKFEKLQEFGRFPLPDDAVDAAERLLLNAAKSTQETLDNARVKTALSYMKKGEETSAIYH
ncbi:unnamed protein product, partial [Didymodactylos carnosus]